MSCCENPQIVYVSGKCSDLCHITYPDGTEKNGYVPGDLNIGSGDYLEFDYCINCGKMVGEFPLEIPGGD